MVSAALHFNFGCKFQLDHVHDHLILQPNCSLKNQTLFSSISCSQFPLQRWPKVHSAGPFPFAFSETNHFNYNLRFSRRSCRSRISRTLNEGNASSLVEEEEEGEEKKSKKLQVLLATTFTVFFGVANRVFYKLALVPLKHYPFFLAQITTFGYVGVYFSILYLRYRVGIVTNDMLALPQFHFLAVGVLEALAAASGMAAATILPGASIPILSQSFLVWQLILSSLFLNKRYSFNQILGCLLISGGVIITVASGGGAGKSLQQAGFFWPLLMVISFLFQAADTVLKEFIFLDASKKLKGGSVDLFVINSFGSAFQALVILLLLPFLSRSWGIQFYQLPNYIKDGAACFINLGSLSEGCQGAPWLPLLFILCNIGFNISLLHLLKISSAVVSSFALTLSVPLSIYIFTFPLPYIGGGATLPSGFLIGVAVLIVGLSLYNFPPSTRTERTA